MTIFDSSIDLVFSNNRQCLLVFCITYKQYTCITCIFSADKHQLAASSVSPVPPSVPSDAEQPTAHTLGICIMCTLYSITVGLFCYCKVHVYYIHVVSLDVIFIH